MAKKWGRNDDDNKYDSMERRGIKTARMTIPIPKTG
jgi:hypothetical protein